MFGKLIWLIKNLNFHYFNWMELILQRSSIRAKTLPRTHQLARETPKSESTSFAGGPLPFESIWTLKATWKCRLLFNYCENLLIELFNSINDTRITTKEKQHPWQHSDDSAKTKYITEGRKRKKQRNYEMQKKQKHRNTRRKHCYPRFKFDALTPHKSGINDYIIIIVDTVHVKFVDS